MKTAASEHVFDGFGRRALALRSARLPQSFVETFIAHAFCVGLVGAILSTWQYNFYCFQATNVWQLDLSVFDRCAVWVSLCATISLLLMPAIMLALAGFAWRGPRVAVGVCALWTFLVVLWLLVEIEIYGTYGRTVADFIGYAGQRSTWELAGDPGSHLWSLLRVGSLGFAVLAFALCVQHACRRWISHWSVEFPRRCLAAVVLCWLALLAGRIAAPQAMSRPTALATLNRALPVNAFGLLPPTAPDDLASAEAQALLSGPLAAFEQLMHRPPLPSDVPLPEQGQTPRQDLPNIVMIVGESLRPDALHGNMPRLESRLNDGFVAQRHYANGNRTETGLFALLYGRPVMEYDATLDRGDPPYLCRILRKWGYTCSFVSSHDPAYEGMDRFVNTPAFDEVSLNREGWWFQRDRQSLADAAAILHRQDSAPKFVVVFLMSTHYNYAYPAEHRLHVPDSPWTRARDHLWNRYRNALRFTDDAIDRLLSQMDLTTDIAIVTGDHGESFYEDGTLTHANRLSEVACRVPLLILGGALRRQRFTAISQHTDVLPTVVHAVSGVSQSTGSSGRDLLDNSRRFQQVMVAHPVTGSDRAWEMLLIREEGRLGFVLGGGQNASRILGYCDEDGRIDPVRRLGGDDAGRWADALTLELDQSRPTDAPR